MHKIQDLKIWQKALDLCVSIYEISAHFPADERFGLTSQVRRSCVSISSNIAEGAGRNTKGEFIHFLGIANGSAYELQTQLIIAKSLNLYPLEVEGILDKIDEIQKMCYKLQQTLKAKNG
ncbi:four helix bundle protein [Sphingobacterium corticibacter]|uniref:Four helix bundle protein n=1 Tax=Sphingobacterium corticibacter TaxID=2171749 RepID=A0A2T8HFI7_9SPHI|nr:four helix bundle protein [Sphingobacterium corticibacter]PVH24174.1 four helix bundle protein [Sphingobacterium corticibacter]